MLDRLRRLLGGSDDGREHFGVMVVRHAESAMTRPSTGLSERGQEQVAAFASSLKKGDCDVLIAGDFPEAIETARALHEVVGGELVVMDAFGSAEDAHLGSIFARDVTDPEVARQFMEGLEDVRATYAPLGKAMVVSGSGLILNALRSLLPDAQIELAAPGILEDGIPSCAITTFEWSGGTWEAHFIAALTIPDI